MSTTDFFRARLDQMIDLRHPLAVLATRLPWASIEASLAPKLAHQAKPAKRVAGVDLAGAFDGEFGGGISPAGRPPARVKLLVASSSVHQPAIAARERSGDHLRSFWVEGHGVGVRPVARGT